MDYFKSRYCAWFVSLALCNFRLRNSSSDSIITFTMTSTFVSKYFHQTIRFSVEQPHPQYFKQKIWIDQTYNFVHVNSSNCIANPFFYVAICNAIFNRIARFCSKLRFHSANAEQRHWIYRRHQIIYGLLAVGLVGTIQQQKKIIKMLIIF